MIIKVMSDDGIPDGDPRKKFRLISDVVDIEFWHCPKTVTTPWGSSMCVEGPMMKFRHAGGATEHRPVIGNVYILDEFGKTIDRFIVDPPRPPAPV